MNSLQFGLRNHCLSTNVRADVLLPRMEVWELLKLPVVKKFPDSSILSSRRVWVGKDL